MVSEIVKEGAKVAEAWWQRITGELDEENHIVAGRPVEDEDILQDEDPVRPGAASVQKKLCKLVDDEVYNIALRVCF